MPGSVCKDIKGMILFLVVMAVLAIFGRLRFPGRKTATCPSCGRPRIGSAACPCGKG
jgi:hypothetical protein